MNETGYADTHLYSSPTGEEIGRTLAPLLEHLRSYDAFRLQLEKDGGTVIDIASMTSILNESIDVSTRYQSYIVRLSDQTSLRRFIWSAAYGNVHMQVRQLASGLPAYYLCRVRRDYWCNYGLVVEDLYTSPGYPIHDERFVQLMDLGREVYHLRLSQFRGGAGAMLDNGSAASPEDIDRLLYSVGRNVFDSAWHEDQRPGVLTADNLDLPFFKQAIELLYLSLSSDLCELRRAVTDDILRFLSEVYEQPAIRALMTKLPDLEGDALNDLPRSALSLYVRLSRDFSRFMNTEVAWGHKNRPTPIYKLVFANFSRLGLIATQLARSDAVEEARALLEGRAEAMIDELINNGSA